MLHQVCHHCAAVVPFAKKEKSQSKVDTLIICPVVDHFIPTANMFFSTGCFTVYNV